MALAVASNAEVLRSLTASARSSAAITSTDLACAIRRAVIALTVGAAVLAGQGLVPRGAATIHPADVAAAAIGMVLGDADATAALADLTAGAAATGASASIWTTCLACTGGYADTLVVGANILWPEATAATAAATIGATFLADAVGDGSTAISGVADGAYAAADAIGSGRPLVLQNIRGTDLTGIGQVGLAVLVANFVDEAGA